EGQLADVALDEVGSLEAFVVPSRSVDRVRVVDRDHRRAGARGVRREASRAGARLDDHLARERARPVRLPEEALLRELPALLVELRAREVVPLEPERLGVVRGRHEAREPVLHDEAMAARAEEAVTLEREVPAALGA